MKVIPLTQGQIAFVDDEDYERVAAYRWYAIRSRSTFYARRAERSTVNGRQRWIRLHHFVLGVPSRTRIDHINGTGTDCQKMNLRDATHQQNVWNQKKPKGTFTSRFKGVFLESDTGKARPWRAMIGVDGRRVHIGRFATEEEAAKAYDKRASELHGAYARPNFPLPHDQRDPSLIDSHEKDAH